VGVLIELVSCPYCTESDGFRIMLPRLVALTPPHADTAPHLVRSGSDARAHTVICQVLACQPGDLLEFRHDSCAGERMSVSLDEIGDLK